MASSSDSCGVRLPASPPSRPSNLLFLLPHELRERIYALVLTSNDPIIWPSPHSNHCLTPTLLRVSKAVYAESGPILYENNCFVFQHPSDCNIFVHIFDQTFARRITEMALRIHQKEVRLWTAYLGSANPVRSLKHDFPALKFLSIRFRTSFWPPDPVELINNFYRWPSDPRLRDLCMNLEGKTDAAIECICIHRIPAQELGDLVLAWRNEFEIDHVRAGVGIVRTKYRKIHQVQVALQFESS